MLNYEAVSTRMETVMRVLLLALALLSVEAEDSIQGEDARGVILNALTFGAGGVSINVSIDGCVWRKGQVVGGSGGPASGAVGEGESCPDPAIKYFLYTSLGSPRREIDVRNPSALASAGWIQQHHTVVLIHGYGGGDNTIPIAILRDAYLSRGDFNVIMVDWGALAAIPCYPAAVHNSAHVGRCAAIIPRMLRDVGAASDAWTCVGHSLGAHVCGAMSDYLSFRVHKIIGLDPARPLVRPTSRFRLDPSDAAVVHVLHTDAGHYGEAGRLGTVDFCVNGGRTQPHCRLSSRGEHLCNHVSAVCFFAESLDPSSSLAAEPCSRRCLAVRLRPGLLSDDFQHGGPIRMGPYSPDSASGTYCANSAHQPYCPRKPRDRGHLKCCVEASSSPSDKPEKDPTYAPGVLDDRAEPFSPPVSSAASGRSEQVATNLTDSYIPAESPIGTESLSAEPTPTLAMNRMSDDGGVVLVLPSTEITLPSSTIPSPKDALTPKDASISKDEEPVFPVYSSMADTASGPVLVVMATPMKNTSAPQENSISVRTEMKEVTKRPRPFSPQLFSSSNSISSSLNSFPPFPNSLQSSPNSFPFSPNPSPPFPNTFPSSPNPFPSLNSFPAASANSFHPPLNPLPTSSSSFPMFAMQPVMSDMMPPKSTESLPSPNPIPMSFSEEMPLGMTLPSTANTEATVPMSPPPPNGGVPIPGAPDPGNNDGDAPIPMAGSLTGPWVAMVMLPPTPFSTDSWKVWSSSKMVAFNPVRRSTYRNYIYE